MIAGCGARTLSRGRPYMLFCANERDVAKAAEQATPTTTELGARWNTADKAEWHEKGKTARDEYAKELAVRITDRG